jgi:hypothetical protein
MEGAVVANLRPVVGVMLRGMAVSSSDLAVEIVPSHQAFAHTLVAAAEE